MKAIAEATELNKAMAQTSAVIKSTGGAAGVTADQVKTLSDRLARIAGVEGEVVQEGANMLLTFTNVRNEAGKGNDVFNQATEVLLDMSAALGVDASQGAIQLGKALNDPIGGVTALRRVGVQLTDQQEAQIKKFVESGDIMSAQKVILAELTKEFGGSAAAIGANLSPMERLNLVFKDVAEAAGTILIPVLNGLLPVIIPLIEALGPALTGVVVALAPALQQLAEVLGPVLTQTITALAPFLPELALAFVGILEALLPLLPPLLELFEALAPLIPVVADLAKQFAGQLVPILRPLIDLLIAVLNTAIVPLAKFLSDNFGEEIGAVAIAIIGFKAMSSVINSTMGIVKNLTGVLPALTTQVGATAAATGGGGAAATGAGASAGSLAGGFLAAAAAGVILGIGLNRLIENHFPGINRVLENFGAKVFGLDGILENFGGALVDIAIKINTVLLLPLGVLKGVMESVGDVFVRVEGFIGRVIAKIKELAKQFNSLKLPDWLTPGSPTPFEIGLRGIREEFAKLDRMNLSFGGVGGGGGIGAVSIPISMHFHGAVGSPQEIGESVRDVAREEITNALERVLQRTRAG